MELPSTRISKHNRSSPVLLLWRKGGSHSFYLMHTNINFLSMICSLTGEVLSPFPQALFFKKKFWTKVRGQGYKVLEHAGSTIHIINYVPDSNILASMEFGSAVRVALQVGYDLIIIDKLLLHQVQLSGSLAYHTWAITEGNQVDRKTTMFVTRLWQNVIHTSFR